METKHLGTYPNGYLSHIGVLSEKSGRAPGGTSLGGGGRNLRAYLPALDISLDILTHSGLSCEHQQTRPVAARGLGMPTIANAPNSALHISCHWFVVCKSARCLAL